MVGWFFIFLAQNTSRWWKDHIAVFPLNDLSSIHFSLGKHPCKNLRIWEVPLPNHIRGLKICDKSTLLSMIDKSIPKSISSKSFYNATSHQLTHYLAKLLGKFYSFPVIQVSFTIKKPTPIQKRRRKHSWINIDTSRKTIYIGRVSNSLLFPKRNILAFPTTKVLWLKKKGYPWKKLPMT